MNHPISMKRIAIATAVTLALASGILIARTAITTYTATEIPSTQVDPGKTTVAGENVHVRDAVRDYNRIASDPRVNGTFRVTMSLNLDRYGAGPMWGSFHGDSGGGSWDGTFQGWFDYSTWQGEYESVGRGSGAHRGLELREHCVYIGQGPGTCTGTIRQVASQ